jgi:Protein of unknown function (DUF2490)
MITTMINRKIPLLFIVSALYSAAFSQKQTANVQQVWLGYFNQTRFSDKWGIWTDLHLRTKENFTNDLSTGIARFGLTYYLTNQVKLTAGYAFVNHFPAEGHTGISQPERRPWQQIQWHTRYTKSAMMQSIRLEERYRRKIKNDDELAEGYNFNYRLRYNISLTVPLTRKGMDKNGFSFVLNNEVHINMGRQITYNYFDQNRFFAGFAYHTNKHDLLQFGYMNLFQQLAVGNRYRNIHAFRVFFFQNIDLRKK